MTLHIHFDRGRRIVILLLVIVGHFMMSPTPILAARGGAAVAALLTPPPPPIKRMSMMIKVRTSSCCFVTSTRDGSGSGALQIFAAKRQRGQGQVGVCRLASSAGAQSRTDYAPDFDHDQPNPKDNRQIIDVPLVFVPGMKGSHLAFDDDDTDLISSDDDDNQSTSKSKKKKRAWLTLGNLLNFPPRPDDDPSRDLSLPLTYDYDPPAYFDGEAGNAYAAHYPRQHQGGLVPDGIVDHIIELNIRSGASIRGDGMTNSSVELNFLPFYGHATRMLRELDREYHSRRHDEMIESTESYRVQDDDETDIENSRGIFDRVGSFVERTSNWAFSNKSNFTATQQQSRHSLKHCRPTAVFSYDWRRPLPELCTSLHEFCEESFPNQPVQIIAHSLGGLMTFAAMREHPEKYAPGAVVVGVPFETGIQYLQDLHKGYYTELGLCRQFTPDKQFSMSSHWAFFPISKDRLEDRFVDVTARCEQGHAVKFDADKSGIGKKSKFQPKVEGDNAWFEFYDPDEWERLDLGIFGPEFDDLMTDEQRRAYKEHMRIQMVAAKKWRQTVLGEDDVSRGNFNDQPFPPLVACASDAVPTVNQILRRKRQSTSLSLATTRKGRQQTNPWEYDYVNGRSVPGDGRIDFDKAFPPDFVPHKRITLDSAHAKQMCWEESGGSWGTVYDEVVDQVERYVDKLNDKEQYAEATTLHGVRDALSMNSIRG